MKPNRVQKTGLAITKSIGSPASIGLHTVLFIASFSAAWSGFITFDRMLLVLTTIVSLEAIYLSIFIQMTINYQAESIEEVEKDIDEIQENIGELQEDVEEISEEEKEEEMRKVEQKKTLSDIQHDLQRLTQDIGRLQTK